MKDFFNNILGCNYLNHNSFYKTVCVPTLLGTITAIWTNIVFILEVKLSLEGDIRIYNSNVPYIIHGIRYTHYIIYITVTIGLVYGSIKKQRHLLLPWIQCKVLECLLYLISLMLSSRQYYFIFLCSLGAFITTMNICLIWFVWKTYKSMSSLPPAYDETPSKSLTPTDMPDKSEPITLEV